MQNTIVQRDNLLKRAYSKLEALLLNIPDLPDAFWSESLLINIYHSALDDLQQAGEEVRDWRMSPDQLERLDASAFRAKVAAILLYFRVPQMTQIGFHK